MPHPRPCVLSSVFSASSFFNYFCYFSLGLFPPFVNRPFACTFIVLSFISYLSHAHIVPAGIICTVLLLSRTFVNVFKSVSPYHSLTCYIIEFLRPLPEAAGCNHLPLLKSACIMHVMLFFLNDEPKHKSNTTVTEQSTDLSHLGHTNIRQATAGESL